MCQQRIKHREFMSTGSLFGANFTIEEEKVSFTGEENLSRYDVISTISFRQLSKLIDVKDPDTLSGTPIS